MDSIAIGDLVTVNGPGAPAEGLVFDMPSATKAVVAVVDPRRGPVFRSINPQTLTARTTAGQHDQALRMLIRRTPPPLPGNGHATANGGGKGAAGFTRGSAHRPTGR